MSVRNRIVAAYPMRIAIINKPCVYLYVCQDYVEQNDIEKKDWQGACISGTRTNNE